MKNFKKISVLISLLLISIIALGAVSAAEDAALADDADLEAVNEITVDDTPTTDEINDESTDIVMTDTGDSSDLDDSIDDVVSDSTGLQDESGNGSDDDAVVTDVAKPKNVLKAENVPDEPLGAPEDDPVGTYKDLWALISNARAGSTINLEQNYAYNPDVDGDWYYRTGSGIPIIDPYSYWYCADGLYINKNLVINGNGHYISGGNATRIFDVNGASLTLNNLTIKEGKSSDTRNWNNNHITTNRQYGGAIYAHGTGVTLNINNCTLVDNHNVGNGQYYSGGAIYATGTTNILGSLIVNNSAYYGGALTIAGGPFNVHGSVIFDNIATFNDGTFGDNAYRTGGTYNLSDNWWGTNKGPEDTIQTGTNTYHDPHDWFILTETLTSPITVEVDFALYRGGTSQYTLSPARFITVTTDNAILNTSGQYCPSPFTIEFTTSDDAIITVATDYEEIHLMVFAGENKKNITELRVVVDNVTLPDQPVAYVYSDVDGHYNLTLGTQVFDVNVVNGEGTYQFSGLNVGQYSVIVSRVDDPVYKTTFNQTDFEVKRYATQLIIDTETPNPTYGTDVTITHTLTPTEATGFITYYVDGSETGTQLSITENFVLSGLSAGEHTVVAKYGGDPTYDVSTSNTLTIIVAPATLEFNVTNVTVNFPNKGTVNVTSNADGVYNVSVNNVEYEVTVANGKGSFEVQEELPVGEYVISWNIPEGNYTAASGTGLYNVTAPAPEFDITGESSINYGQNNTITHTITEGATGTISYTVNDSDYGTLGLDEDLVLENLPAGHYVVVATYSGGGNYGPTSDSFEFDVLPIDVSVTVTSPEVIYPNKGTIVLNASAPGTYTVKVGNKNYTATVTAAGVPVEVPVNDLFDVGAYDISVTADLGENYNPVDTGKIGTYTVTKPSTSLVIDVSDFTYGTEAYATITLKQGITALVGRTINVTVDGIQQTAITQEGGVATVALGSLGVGKHNIVAIFDGDENYAYAYNITDFNVTKAAPTLAVSTEAIIYGNDAIINIALEGVNGEKITGVVKVSINGKDYDVAVSNGVGTLTVSRLAANEVGYPITAVFAGNDNYNATTNDSAKQVVNKADATISVANVTISYGEDAIVTINLTGVNGEKLNGTIGTYVNGTNYQDVNIVNGTGFLNASDLTVGIYDIQTRYYGNDNYNARGVIAEKAITVNKAAVNVTAANVVVTYPEKGVIAINASAPGDYVVKVGTKTYTVTVATAGVPVEVQVTDIFEVGAYNISVTAPETDDHAAVDAQNIATYTVNKANLTIEVKPNATEIVFGEEIKLNHSIDCPEGALLNGVITYYVDGSPFTGTEILSGLTVGTHTVAVRYTLDPNFNDAESEAKTITVTKATPTVTIVPTKDSFTFGDDVVINVTVKDGDTGISGVVNLTINNVDYAVTVTDGVGQITVKGLPSGTYPVTATLLPTENYNGANAEPATVVVDPSDVALVNAEGSTVTYGEDSTIKISVMDDEGKDVAVSKVNVTINDNTKEYDVVDGIVTLGILDAGTYTATVSFVDGVHTVKPGEASVVVNPQSGVQIDASAANYPFNEEGKLVIDVKDADGNALDGDITVVYNGNPYNSSEITGGHIEMPLNGFAVGEQAVEVIFSNPNYLSTSVFVYFNVTKVTPTVTIAPTKDSFAYGEDVVINVTLKDGETNLSGIVKVTVGGTGYSVEVTNGVGQVTVKGLANGTYDVAAKFLGNENYTEADAAAASFVVNASTDAIITAAGSEVTYGEDSTVTITVKDGAGYDIAAATVKINGTDCAVTDGVANIGILDVGTYILPVVFDDGVHKAATTEVTLIVKPLSAEITAVATDYVFDETGKLTITVKDGDGNAVAGKVNVTIDGASYKFEDIDGSLEVTLENFAAGLHNVDVAFVSPNYAASTAQTTFTVTKKTPAVSITVEPATIKQTDSTTVKVSLLDGDKKLDGTVKVTVGGVDYFVTVTAGEGSVVVSNLAPANYTVTAKFDGNENYTEAVADGQKLEVTRVAKVDLNVSTDGNNIVIKLTDEDKKPVDGKVNVTIDGKTQEVTVKNGVASVPTTPGNHNVTVVYPGDAVHGGTKVVNNIVNVNPKVVKIGTVFTVSRMKVPTYNKYLDKKKDYVIYATLKDVNGKVLAGKKVKYASHGKTVIRTTNSKGQIKFYVTHTPAGMCNRALSFIGDSKYKACFKTVGVKIYRQKAKLVVKKKTFKATKKVKKFTATLTNMKGKKIGGRKIVFTINGKKYTAKTNKKGIATVKVKLTRKKTYSVKVKFAGDKTFLKASKKSSIKIS